MRRVELLKRVGVLFVVAFVIIAVAAAIPLATPSEKETDTLATPEYATNEIVSDPISTAGTINPNVPPANRRGVVLIDQAHANQLSRAELLPLISGLTSTGHTVKFVGISDNFSKSLSKAKALIVIDPNLQYSDDQLDAVDNFTDRGGHLLLVAEPDRIRIGPFGASLVTRTSEVTQLASRHGVSFDTRYLYDLETNDGNYKHVFGRSASGTDLRNVDRTVLYTATTVSVRRGTALLVTPESTRLSDGGPTDRHTVAAKTNETLAVGDSTFLQANRYTVADNEAFITYVVEFLAAGERGGT